MDIAGSLISPLDIQLPLDIWYGIVHYYKCLGLSHLRCCRVMSVTLMLNSPWTSGTGLFTGVAFFVRLKHKQLNLISLCGQSINLSGSFEIQKRLCC